jgi:hypothetical protein
VESDIFFDLIDLPDGRKLEAVDISNEDCQARNKVFDPLIFAGNCNRY